MSAPDLSRIIYGLPEPVLLVAPEGTVVAANPGASRLFRRPAKELVGRPLDSLLADDHEKLARYLRLCSRNSEGIPAGFSIRDSKDQPIICKAVGGLVHHREGQSHLVWLRLLPREATNTRFAAYNERLVTLIKENRARQESEQRWRTAFESSAIGIAMTDLEGRFLAVNAVFQKMVGYSESELRQFSFLDITYEEDRKGNMELVQELLTGKRQHFQLEKCYRHKNGTLLWVRNNASLVPGSGSVRPFLFAVVEDITQRKRVEEERKRLEQELQRERDRLRLILDLNNRIVSNLDLRGLFSVIAEELRRLMECDMVGIALPEPGGNLLRQQLLDLPISKGRLREGLLIPIEGSPTGLAFRKAKPIAVPSLQSVIQNPEFFGGSRGSEFSEVVPAEGFKSACFLPLMCRSRVLGVLQLVRREEYSFAEDDVNFLAQVASQIAIAVDNALNYQRLAESRARLAEENLYLEEEIRREHDFEEIVGNSVPLRELLRKVELVGPTESTVLICGETGTGKELVARAIHALSPRRHRPLVKVNCGSIPAGLVESELFGHVKGAFTGATGNRTGRFELANGGTIFLDEVGELPLDTQVKLLRVLQEQEFEPVGGSRTIRVDVRIVAATNRDLDRAVQAGQFRSDLYYRLNVLPLQVPGLRDRRSDIPQLVMFFLERFCKKTGKKIDSVPQETMELLLNYAWPGNIRELQNIIERGVVLSPGSVLALGAELLPVERPQTGLAVSESPKRSAKIMNGRLFLDAPSLQEVERGHILAALERTKGVISGDRGAAALLKINPNTLRSRIKKLGITRSRDDIS